MKNLRLIPAVHKQQPVIKASFAFDKELIALVKSQKGARWSQTLHSWYFPKKELQLNNGTDTRFIQGLLGHTQQRPRSIIRMFQIECWNV